MGKNQNNNIDRAEYDIEEIEDEKMGENNQHSQKVLFGGLIFFGIMALILAFFQLKYSLKKPFIKGTEQKIPNLVKKDGDTFNFTEADSRDKDTDNDGLSDYDEIYVYGTSPYLEDSDSDDYSDKMELDTNNDPNCPKDKDCLYFDGSSTNESGDDFLPDISGKESINSDMSANDLRQMLISAEMPKSVLDQISDEILMNEFAQIAEEQDAQENEEEIDKKELINMTPDQIREFLRLKGFDDNLLSSIDDETLKKDFMETVSSVE